MLQDYISGNVAQHSTAMQVETGSWQRVSLCATPQDGASGVPRHRCDCNQLVGWFEILQTSGHNWLSLSVKPPRHVITFHQNHCL